MKSILYITHDGLTEHIGRSQIIPYLTAISDSYKLTIISREKDSEQICKTKNLLNEYKNISWEPLIYPKNASSLSFLHEFLTVIYKSVYLLISGKFEILHCRCYPASFMGVIVKIISFGKVKFLFDIRDFWIDARLDTSKKKLPYRILKFFEKLLYYNADGYVTLTERAKNRIKIQYPFILENNRHVNVIPCCCDFNRFNPANISQSSLGDLRESLNLKDKFVIGYLGSLGPDYLIHEMIETFQNIGQIKKNSILLIITSTPEIALDQLNASRLINSEQFIIKTVDNDEVQNYISLFDLSLVFIRPDSSKMGCSPTKVGELLALNIPIIANTSVGDLDNILKYDLNLSTTIDIPIIPNQVSAYMEKICKESDMSFIRANSEYFSLALGVRKYLRAYNNLYD